MKTLMIVAVIALQGCASVWEFAPSPDDYVDLRDDASHTFCRDGEVSDIRLDVAVKFSCTDEGPSLVQLDLDKSLEVHLVEMSEVQESICPDDTVRRYSSINGNILIDCSGKGRSLITVPPFRSLSSQLRYIDDLKAICPDAFSLRSIKYPYVSRRVAEFNCGSATYKLQSSGLRHVQDLDAAVCGLEGFQSLKYNLNNAEYVCKSGETGVVGI